MKRLLLDECIPRKFKSHLSGHDCVTVPEAGWAGKKNGELLSLAENAGFQAGGALLALFEKCEANRLRHEFLIFTSVYQPS